MTTLTLRASWRPRPEDEDSVAAQLSAFVPHLEAFSPAYAGLTRSRDNPRQPLVPMPRDPQALAEELRRGRIRNDTDRAIMPGAGFSCGWDDNTRRFEQASLFIGAGRHHAKGSVSVAVPEEVVPQLTLEAVRKLFTALVEVFDPDSAAVGESSSIVVRNARNEFVHSPGWLLYLRDGPSLPTLDGVITSRVGRGKLYVVDEPTFDAASPRYQERTRSLRDALARTGADVG